MKKLLLITIIFISIIGCTSKDDSWNKVKNSGRLVLGFDEMFPPMGFMEEGEYVGFDIDLAKEVAKRLDLELILKPIPWEHKENLLANNEIDCIWNGYSITEERKKLVTFSKPYLSNKQVMLVLDESPKAVLVDLRNSKLALQKYSSAEEVLDNNKDLKNSLKEVLLFDNYLDAVDCVNKKLCDAVMLDIIYANYYYIRYPSSNYRILTEVVADDYFGVGFRKEDNKLKDKVESTLVSMAKDGTLEKISIKWFGADITLFSDK